MSSLSENTFLLALLLLLHCFPAGSRDTAVDSVKPELMAQLVENISALTETAAKKASLDVRASDYSSDDEEDNDNRSDSSSVSDGDDDDDFE